MRRKRLHWFTGQEAHVKISQGMLLARHGFPLPAVRVVDWVLVVLVGCG